MRPLKEYIKHPSEILLGLLIRCNSLFSDKLYLKLRYRLEMGKSLDLKNPKTMNEKLQWLKLYNRKPEFTSIVDKILVKDIIASKLGPEYVIPTLEVWDNASDIDISNLPDKFVVKTNHGGGNTGVFVCKDKTKCNLSLLKEKMATSMKSNIYNSYREWPYKNIEKKIFAEPYIGYKDEELVDYKFFCFDGKVDSVMLCLDRQIGDAKFYFFDEDWNLKRYNVRGKKAPKNFTVPKPKNVAKMFEIASTLSKGFPFLRVDLYNINGKIYFGELTFFPASGFDNKILPEMDLYWGNKINLIKA